MPRAIVNMRLFTVAIAVAVIHFSTGLILLTDVPAALRTTPLAVISAIFNWNESAVAAALILSAILSVVPFLIRQPKRAAVVLCILPQQAILVTHLVSALIAIYTGTSPMAMYQRRGPFLL